MKKALLFAVWLTGSGICLAGANGGPVIPDIRSQATGTVTITGTQTIAEEGECTYNEYFITGTVTGEYDDTGTGYDQVTCEVWDDGELKDSQTIEVPVGETIPLDVTLSFKGRYLTGAPGVGIGCEELGVWIDPFYPEDVNGSCPKNGIQKCWVTPHKIAAGKKVTFNVEIIGNARVVQLYNGNLPVKIGKKTVTLTDPDGDNVYSVSYRIPKTSSVTGPWLFDYKIRAVGNWKGDDWCPGIMLR